MTSLLADQLGHSWPNRCDLRLAQQHSEWGRSYGPYTAFATAIDEMHYTISDALIGKAERPGRATNCGSELVIGILRLLGTLLAPPARRHACDFTECVGKVRLATETKIKCYANDCGVRTGQHLLRPSYAAVKNVGVGGISGGSPKLRMEMNTSEARDPAQLRQEERPADVVFDIVDHSAKMDLPQNDTRRHAGGS